MAEAAERPTVPAWLNAYPAGIDWHAEIPERPLHALLDDAVARYADRPAADFMGKKYTYAEIGRAVDRFAKGLQGLGVKKGDRVGLFLPNSPYFVIAYFAVLKCGGIVVNFNPLYAEREIAKQITDSGASVMVTVDVRQLVDKLEAVNRSTPVPAVVLCRMAGALPAPKSWLYPIAKAKDVAKPPKDGRYHAFDRLIDNDGRFAPVDVDPGDIAVLQYTGGTTGLPKGAMLTHANIYANTWQSSLWFPDAALGQERTLGVLPFFHVFAMTVVMNFSVMIGAEIVMLPRFELDQVMKILSTKRPTLFPAVPTIYTAINGHKHLDRYDISSLKFCLSGGASLPVEVKQTFERLTGCKLVEGYGLTESSPVATANPLDGVNKTGSIGLPLPGTTVEIVDLEDRTKVLGIGERGEVCLSGPQIMKGYWNREEETADTLADGRLHTGDVGYMDEDGYTFIVDRIKDLILAGGYNVYPRNVEEAIYLHPSVEEVVCGGVPDPYRGQTVKVWIKLVEGRTMTQDDLKTFLKDKLSPIEMPRLVEFRDAPLPKTMIGKLSRKTLVEEDAAKTDGG